MARATGTQAAKEATAKTQLRGKIKSDFPKHSLEEALRVPVALFEKNGGRPLPPVETAQAVELSPGNSEYRILLSSSFKYGLTNGSYKSDRISLEVLGQNIVEAKSPEAKSAAIVSAALNPGTFKAIYEALKGKKLPDQSYFENTVVREHEVPREHAAKCVEVFVRNMEFIGAVKTVNSGKWLSTAIPTEGSPSVPDDLPAGGKGTGSEFANPEEAPKAELCTPQRLPSSTNNRVFIAHGKNLAIVAQLKELLAFGKFEPFVSIENESTAQPVPDKVIGEMKQCAAAVINVAGEEELLDSAGNKRHRLNENVLIEIGAALALYGNNFILLVQKGVHLPSDLQGLYRCDYDGDKLDYDATMKLLRTFNKFKSS